MKKKNRVAIILVILLSGLTFWISTRNNKGTIKQSLRDFAIADTASVTKIFLADKAKNTVTLDKVKPGQWKVNGTFDARNDAINTLLYTMKAIEVREPVGKKAQENVVKGLASGATKVEVYKNNEEKPFKVYFVGGETSDQTGTFMLLQDAETGVNSSIPFIMYIPGFEGYLTTRYFTRAGDWRSRMVFNYIAPEIKNVKVEYPKVPENGYEVSNLGNNRFAYKALAGVQPAAIDTLAIKQYLTYFSNIQFEALERGLKKPSQDSVTAQQPGCIVTLTDQLDKKSIVKVFPMANVTGKADPQGNVYPYDQDRMYALVNNGEDFVVMQFFVFGTIMQDQGYFMPKKGVKKP